MTNGPLPASRRTLLRSAIALAGLAISGEVARAKDYRPVRCDARVAYSGPPLHPPVLVRPIKAVPDRPLPSREVARLDEAFARIRTLTAAPALTAAVARPGRGIWQRTWSQQAHPRLWWASVGKTFTAVVVLQLVQEGKLALDAPVSRFLHGVPNGDLVTLRDCLAHTSGLFSANEDRLVRARPGYRDPATLLAIARRHGAMFCPGERWRYSNTGYDLLGEIVRRVDGRPINEAITARIIAPLGLGSMRALLPGKSPSDVAPAPGGRESIDPSWAGAAGPIASDGRDMAMAWAALLEGRLLDRALLKEMTATLYPMFDPGTFYGLGIMVFEVPDGQSTLRWVGHAGGAPGVSALAAYSRADDAIVAVALTGGGSATAAANLLLKSVARAGRRP